MSSVAVAGLAEEGVRRLVTARAGRLRRASVTGTIAAATVTAAVCVPIALPLLAASSGTGVALLAAALAQVGGVGVNLLTDVIKDTWERMAPRGEGAEDEFEEAVSDQFAVVLARQDADAARLRAEMAAVLRGTDAVRVALSATVEQSASDLRATLVAGFESLGTSFSEFGWMLDDVQEGLVQIGSRLTDLELGQRRIAEDLQRSRIELALLRTGLRRSRPASDPARTRQSQPPGDPAEKMRHGLEPDGTGALIRVGSPYPGLAPFDAATFRNFHGRDVLTARLVARLGEQCSAPGMLIVLGSSGSGKSSLLRAGLLPALADGALAAPGAEDWPQILMTPGDRPLARLSAAIGHLAGALPGTLAGDLRADPGTVLPAVTQALLADAARRAAAVPAPDSPVPAAVLTQTPGDAQALRLLLVVDQLEELFSQCPDEDERAGFLDVLRACAGLPAVAAGSSTMAVPVPRAEVPPVPSDPQTPPGPCLVVLGLRSDFYARCAGYPQLRPILEDRPVLVGPLDEAGLREAIRLPARDTGVQVEPDLVERLLRDLGVAAHADAQAAYPVGRLPLLAHVLRETWNRSDGEALTVADYELTGGIDGAIAATAERLYGGFSPGEQVAARRLMLRMVSLGEAGTGDTRRRVRPHEIAGEDAAHTEQVLDTFIAARLVTATQDGVEITHEALLREWPRLRGWLTDDRAGLRLHRELTEDANDWNEDADPDRLYRGARLALIQEWVEDHPHELNPVEQAFVAASVAAHQARTAADRQRARRLRALSATLAVLLVLTVAAAAVAVLRGREADEQTQAARAQARLALSRQLAVRAMATLTDDPRVAAGLALEAYRVSPSSEATDALERVVDSHRVLRLTGHTGPVGEVAWNPDGTRLATSGSDLTVRMWDPSKGVEVHRLSMPSKGEAAIGNLAWNVSGTMLVAVAGDDSPRVWDPVTGNAQALSPPEPSQAASWSPDGSLGVLTDDGRLWRWDPATRRSITRRIPSAAVVLPYEGGILPVWNADGTALALSTRAGGVAIVDGLDASLRAIIDPGEVRAAWWSPDGRMLATVNTSGEYVLWDARTGTRKRVLAEEDTEGNPDGVDSGLTLLALWSPDGRTVMTTYAYGSYGFEIWDARTGRLKATITGDDTVGVLGARWSPDGSTIATWGAGERILLWDATTGGLREQLAGHPGGVASVAWSGDSGMLASVGADGALDTWDTAPLRLRAALPTGGRAVLSMAWTRDGRQLLVGRPDGAALLSPVDRSAVALPGAASGTTAVTVSPDGRWGATGAADASVTIWDLYTRTLRTVLRGGAGAVTSVVWSPDGRMLVTMGREGARRWDVATWQSAGTVPGSRARAAAWSPEGGHLLLGLANGSWTMWDERARTTGPIVPAHQGEVRAVASSPDGNSIATAGAEGEVRVWDPASRRARATISVGDGGDEDPAVAVAWSPDGQNLAMASGAGDVQIWNGSGDAIRGRFQAPAGTTSIAWAPDGRALAVGGRDTRIRIWDAPLTDPRALSARLCSGRPVDLTPDEWRRYLPDQPYRRSCTGPEPA